jgi:hypothetical protein
MIVTIEPAATPLVRLALTRAELERILGGASLPFELTVGGVRRRVELLRMGGEPAAGGTPPDHRLHLPAELFHGVSVGGSATPIFEDLPFRVVIELAPGEAPAQGPVRISPGVVYEQLVSPAWSAQQRQATRGDAPAVTARRTPNPWLLLPSGLVILGLGIIGVLAKKNAALGVLIALGGVAVIGWGVSLLVRR